MGAGGKTFADAHGNNADFDPACHKCESSPQKLNASPCERYVGAQRHAGCYNFHIMKLGINRESGTTLAELMISTLLVATFFASIFEVNAVCLRMVAGSKENVAAIQGVQDRLETLRSLNYTDLTSATYLRDTVMPTPSNSSEFAKKVIEDITVTAYDTDSATGGTSGSGIKIQRPAGATATAAYVGTPDSTISTAKAVLVTVKYQWNMALTGRSRVEETSSIISAGVKK